MTSQWQPVGLLRELWTKLLASPHLLKITAGVLLIIAVILALFDRVAAGSLVAALFVVVALLEFLPQMESFAAFGIKAQWRKKLDEAEEILEKLKQSTKASALLGYYLLGWGSRMGGQTTGMKRDVADQIDKALTNLGVDPDTLAIFKRDYLFFARYDLFQTFDAIASSSQSGHGKSRLVAASPRGSGRSGGGVRRAALGRQQEASALFQQGAEFGDNGALLSSIEVHRHAPEPSRRRSTSSIHSRASGNPQPPAHGS